MKPLGRSLEHLLLRHGGRLVPADQRQDWLRTWQGELWHAHHRRGHHDLAMGMLRDALWLRAERWRQGLTGTAALCLLLLLCLNTVAALPAWIFENAAGAAPIFFLHMLPRFAVAALLTLFVSYATAFAGGATPETRTSRTWLRASAFHLAKVFLVLLLAALLSIDLCLPLEQSACFAALPLELLVFVVLALFGLRWNLLDGQGRCRHCLRRLAPPQRIGRPSWNFLEYNGTELACREGHGLLTVPELETSWCRTSTWITQSL